MNGEMTQPTHDLAVAQQLPPNLMLLKMENESIMSVARAVPREPMKIVEQLQQLIDAYPAAADEAVYRKPVGTVIEVTCGKCGIRYEVSRIEKDTACPACDSTDHGPSRKVKKFAEGLSIRAAESIRSIYGYTRLAVTEEAMEDGKVKLTGVLVDYAAGNLTSDERIVSPFYKSRGGGMQRTAEDRFLNVVVKAEKAKLRRDVILDSIPNIVKAMFRDACDKKLKALVAPEVIEQKIVPAFAQHGVNLDQLERVIGRPRKLGWREEDRLELRKILAALNNGETTAAELLADLDPKPTSTKPAGATMEDLARTRKPEETTRKPEAHAAAGKTERPEGVDTAAPGPAGEDQQPAKAGPSAEAEGPEPVTSDGAASQAAEAVKAEYRRMVAESARIGDVNGLEKQAAADARLSPADRNSVSDLCEGRRHAIRVKRGLTRPEENDQEGGLLDGGQ